MISKCIKKVKIVKVKKGTVIYTTGMPPEDGYLILHGYVELLTKKTAR
jgi:CRP-like cAMP-binding protein